MATQPPDDPADHAPGEPAPVDLDDSEQPPRILHDAFFKESFSQPGNAAAVLQAILPPPVARHIDWSSLALEHASLVGDLLRQQHGDLLFSARLNSGGGELFLWLLFEHQSTVDYWMIRRMLDFSVKFWQRWLARHPDARHLPAILPVVLYHGREPWNAPTSFRELFDLTHEQRRDLGEHLLSYRFVLDDLRTTEDADLKARPVGPVCRLRLIAMKHGPAAELLGHLVDLHQDIRALMASKHGRAELNGILLYIGYVNPHLDRDILIKELVPVVGPEFEDTMLTFGQKLKQEGFEQGLEQGLENQRAFVRRLLEQRFGALPATITHRIGQANSDDIERWGLRILTADSLDDIFAP